MPSHRSYGRAISDRGAVQIIKCSGTRVKAWVEGLSGTVAEGGGSRRWVEFTLSGEELHWHCTGNPADHQIFCKHCVALALTLPKDRG